MSHEREYGGHTLEFWLPWLEETVAKAVQPGSQTTALLDALTHIRELESSLSAKREHLDGWILRTEAAEARERELRHLATALADAADEVGVNHFDTDTMPGMTATKLLAEVRASMQFVDIPIPRPSTGGTDGKSPEAIAEDIVSQVAVNEYQAHRLVDLIAAAVREDRASRATTEARVREPDHCYDADNWEYSLRWEDRDLLVDGLPAGEMMRVSTLFDGPDKYAAHVVPIRDVDGDAEDSRIRWFDTEEEARAALSDPPSIPTPPASEAGE